MVIEKTVFTSLYVPNSECVVTAARQELGGVPADVDAPDGAVVAVECAQSLAVQGPPNIWLFVLTR